MNRIGAISVCLAALLSLGAGQPTQPGKLPPGHPGAPPTADTWPRAKPADVESADAILAAMYAATGGEPGQARDWDRYRSLFLPDARLIAARQGPQGSAAAMFLTIGQYVDTNRKYFEKGGFYDREIARRMETYGAIAQVWSTYESRHKADDPEPYVRGINSIQLLKDGDRWWIVNVFWDFERPESPIPDPYLKSPSK
jgi:hypothetical protein